MMRHIKNWIVCLWLIVALLAIGASAKQVTQAASGDTSVTDHFTSDITDADLYHSGSASDPSTESYKYGQAMVDAAKGIYPALAFDSVTSSKMRDTTNSANQAIADDATLTFTIKKGTTTPNPFPENYKIDARHQLDLNDIGQILIVFSFNGSVTGLPKGQTPIEYLPTTTKAIKINGNQTGNLTVGTTSDDVRNDGQNFIVNKDLVITLDLAEARQELAANNKTTIDHVSPTTLSVRQQFGNSTRGDVWYKVVMGNLAFTLALKPTISSIIKLPDTPLAKQLFGDDTAAVVIGKGTLPGDDIYYSTTDLAADAVIGSGGWQTTGVTVGVNKTWVWYVPKGVLDSGQSDLYFTERSTNDADTPGKDGDTAQDPFAGMSETQTEAGLHQLDDGVHKLTDPSSDPDDIDDALKELNNVLNPDTTPTGPTDSDDSDQTDPQYTLTQWRTAPIKTTVPATVDNMLFIPTNNDSKDVTDSMVMGAYFTSWGYLGANTYVQTEGGDASIPSEQWDELRPDGSAYPAGEGPISIEPAKAGTLNATLTFNSGYSLTAAERENGLNVVIRLRFNNTDSKQVTLTRTIHLMAITPQTTRYVIDDPPVEFKLNNANVQSLSGATYQWQRQAKGATDWQNINATQSTLSLGQGLTLDNTGDRYRLKITKGDNSYISDYSTLTVLSGTGISEVPDFTFKLNGKDPTLADLVGTSDQVLTADGGKFAFSYGGTGAWVLRAKLGGFAQTDGSKPDGQIGLSFDFTPDANQDTDFKNAQITDASPDPTTTLESLHSGYAGLDTIGFFDGDAQSRFTLSGKMTAVMGMQNVTQLKPGKYDADITWEVGTQSIDANMAAQ